VGSHIVEIWKTIEYFPRYDISSEQRVRNNKSGRILKVRGNRLVISDGGEEVILYIDALMDEYFGDEWETWRDVTQASGYEVSDRGRIRNRRTKRLQSTYTRSNGREYVQFTDAGERFEIAVSEVVASAFRR
jgi:hypothetical protein